MVRQARALLDEARSAAGVAGPHTITVYLIAITGPDAAERLAAELRSWSLDPADDVAITGGAQELAEGIRRWTEAGADAVVLQPTADEPDLEGFIDLIGREVRPLC
jgi:alkanesulfonate monooxygenase SsuD/methylene tetrahydromethanopterin reductase-like flavin-dependent oxidoreductase (luciferase family)